jgi:hypothetical protein
VIHRATPLGLIRRMLAPEPDLRPRVDECLQLVSRWKVLQNFGAHAQITEQRPILITYRGEIQPEMLMIAAALREHFGDQAVIHGLSDLQPSTCSASLLMFDGAVCEPGRFWADLYFEWMKHAAVVLHMHSENYFSSSACRDEFEHAVTKEIPDKSDPSRVVIPLVVRSCHVARECPN